MSDSFRPADDSPSPSPAPVAVPLPPPPGARRPPGPRLSGLWFVTGPLLVVLVGTLILAAALPVPYFALSPGSARSVEPLITFTGDEATDIAQDPADDDLLFVTVSVSRDRLSGIEALWGLLQDKIEVVPEVFVIGSSTPEKNSAFNAKLMTDSQDVARKVALERLGYPVETKREGAVITDLSPDFPAAEVLSPGDTVVAAGGRPVTSVDDLVAAIGQQAPGDAMAVTVLPLGATATKDLEVELGADPADATTARLGVTLEDRVSFTFPFDVAIDSGKVGGPSAGLAFTLAILDRLTPGSLTGDERVAVTGTIELDASVGPVGGVDHKAEAAISAGAKLFIVPSDEYDLARKTAGSRLEVRRADTLDEALAVLEAFGGDPVPAATGSGSGG